MYNCINVFVGSVKRKGQCKHEQPIEQTGDLFCTCDSSVARCQSQNQCHFWQINSMFEAYCTDKWAWQLSMKYMPFMRLWTVAQRFIKGLLWKCKYTKIYLLLRPNPIKMVHLTILNFLTYIDHNICIHFITQFNSNIQNRYNRIRVKTPDSSLFGGLKIYMGLGSDQ